MNVVGVIVTAGSGVLSLVPDNDKEPDLPKDWLAAPQPAKGRHARAIRIISKQ